MPQISSLKMCRLQDLIDSTAVLFSAVLLQPTLLMLTRYDAAVFTTICQRLQVFQLHLFSLRALSCKPGAAFRANCHRSCQPGPASMPPQAQLSQQLPCLRSCCLVWLLPMTLLGQLWARAAGSEPLWPFTNMLLMLSQLR